MSYQVQDYMTKAIHTVVSHATVRAAAEVMAADPNFEGYVIVLEKGKPIGIVTERDIVNQVVAHERDPSTTRVSAIMSRPLIRVAPDADLLTASQLMREHNIRKLVVTRNDIVYGIITAKDIAQQAGNYVDKSIKDIIRWSAPLGI